MFSSKDADKKMGSGIPKVIQPGNVIARVLDMKLEVPPYDANAYGLMLMLETQPIEDGFEGLAINKDVPEMGNYEGQVARVQTHQYSYSDYTNKEGKTTSKEDMIFRWIWNFAKEIGATKALIDHNVEGNSITEYVENAKKYLIGNDRWIHWCIGGSEYENKAGYTQHRLFIVKPENSKIGYALQVADVYPSKLIVFNEAVHIKKKKVSDSLSSFEGKDAGSELLDLD